VSSRTLWHVSCGVRDSIVMGAHLIEKKSLSICYRFSVFDCAPDRLPLDSERKD